MQGEKKFEPKLYYDVNLINFIGPDHFLVRLDRAISLEWIRERTPIRTHVNTTPPP